MERYILVAIALVALLGCAPPPPLIPAVKPVSPPPPAPTKKAPAVVADEPPPALPTPAEAPSAPVPAPAVTPDAELPPRVVVPAAAPEPAHGVLAEPASAEKTPPPPDSAVDCAAIRLSERDRNTLAKAGLWGFDEWDKTVMADCPPSP